MKNTKLTLWGIVTAIAVILATTVSVSAHTTTASIENVSRNLISFSKIMMIVFFMIWVFVMYGGIVGTIKSIRINKAMREISYLPNEQTVYHAIEIMKRTKGVVRFMISSSGRSQGVHFEMWRDVFNNVVIPCNYITPDMKKELRAQLVRLNTHGLRNVDENFAHHKPYVSRVPRAPYVPQTPEEAQVAARNFGVGGEDNVWHNLKVLASQPTCDVYRNVKIKNGATSSEIDAVVVDENKGVFLFEIKSVGGRKATDGYKHIAYSDLKEDPSNQIIRHQYDFSACFTDINLSGKIRNVLVFSWPNGEERRVVDKATFSHLPYEVITVEQLLTYYQTSSGSPLTSQERKLIASRMGSNRV